MHSNLNRREQTAALFPNKRAFRFACKNILFLASFAWLFGLAPQQVLYAQSSHPEISRLKHCIPPRPEREPLEEQTLCEQYLGLTESSANKVIGSGPSSISYSANEKDPLGPIGLLGWSGQTLLINGTLIVNDDTWFLNCTVKFGPGARIIVQQNLSFFAWFSRFFACDQMWEGIRLEPNSNGSFGYCHIQDANTAIHTTRDVPIVSIANRFNRNNVGVRSAHTAVAGTFIPTTLSTYYFFDNEFTLTSPLNSPYPGQVFLINRPTGILLRRASTSLSGLSNAPNRFSRLGYGIYAAYRNESLLVGNSIFTDQDVSGIFIRSGHQTIDAANPCTFEDNYFAGIETERGLSLNVSGCAFGAESAQYFGILTDAQWANNIGFNSFVQDADHLAAIYYVRGRGYTSIYQNTLDITSLSNGIVVETPIGASTQGYCSIEQNPITINQSSWGATNNIGIHVIGGSGDNFTIYGNDIDVRVLGGPHYNVRGILFDQCTGLGHDVSSNNIFNTDVLNTGKSATQGISIRNVQNGVYCYNTTTDTYEGITFFGNNAPARIERNHFNRHNYSLVVDGDAGFAPAVVGEQRRAVNSWELDGYKLLAAACTGDPELSRFRIHSPDFFYFPPPPFVNPPGWFVPDFGDPNSFNVCAHRPDAPELFETKIADGTYFDANSTALLHWEMERNLYYKMLRNPAYGSDNAAFAAFFAAKANTTVGKFAKVERDLYLAGGYSPTIISGFQALEAQRTGILAQLAQLEASAQPPTQPEGVNGQLATAKQTLLDELNDLGEQQSVLLDQHETASAAQLATIRAYNAAIATTEVFEENQKVLNEIGIKMALGEPFLASDLTALEDIADQSETTAGTTQWRAASMLPCRLEMETAYRSKLYETVGSGSVSLEQLFSVAPNPATDRISLRFARAYAGVVAILDTHGRILRSETVAAPANEPVHLIVSDLPNGVYFLQIRDHATQSALQKVVIAR